MRFFPGLCLPSQEPSIARQCGSRTTNPRSCTPQILSVSLGCRSELLAGSPSTGLLQCACSRVRGCTPQPGSVGCGELCPWHGLGGLQPKGLILGAAPSVSPQSGALKQLPSGKPQRQSAEQGRLCSSSPLPAPTSMSPAERLMWLCHSLSPHSLSPALLPRGSAQGTGPNLAVLWGQDGAPSIPLLLPVPTSSSPGHLATLIHLKQTLEPIIQPCLPLPLPPPQTDGG